MHVVLLWRFHVAHVHAIDLRVRVPLLGGAQRWVSRPAFTRPVARPRKINTLLGLLHSFTHHSAVLRTCASPLCFLGWQQASLHGHESNL